MLQLDDYLLEKFLGKGTFGEVYLTKKSNTNLIFATKRMEKALVEDPRYKKYFANEVAILKKLYHKNIIRIQECKYTQNHYYIIMEYCNGGSLTQCLKIYKEMYHHPFTEELVQYLMRQIVSAVKYIHSQGIVHRDLKLDNILVNFNNDNDKNSMNLFNAQVKIIDFGFASAKENSGMFTTAIGSPLNMDPLILKKFHNGRADTNDLQYDEKADIWSLGALCYQMLIGDSPFDAYNMQELVQKIENGTYSVPTSLSKEVVSFLNGMLQYEPQKRLTAENLSNHAFLTKNVSDFSRINTNLISKNIYGGQLNINIKNNQSIWAIFNENDQEQLNNIPVDLYNQDAPLSESVYINVPNMNGPGITSKPYDEDQDFLSTNFDSTASVPITGSEILKSGSTPIAKVNQGFNVIPNIQKNQSGAQFQNQFQFQPNNNMQYSPQIPNYPSPQINGQNIINNGTNIQGIQEQGFNGQIQRQVQIPNQNTIPQNIPYRRPPSDNNIMAGKNIPAIEQPELIRRQLTNPSNLQTLGNNQFNNNMRNNINQPNNNLNQQQNGLKIMPRMQLTNNIQKIANNQIQRQNMQLPVNQIQQQNNIIQQRPNNIIQQRPNNQIQQLHMNQIQQQKNQMLPQNNIIQPRLNNQIKQIPNNQIQRQNNKMHQLSNNQIQQQQRQIMYPNNPNGQQNLQYKDASANQNKVIIPIPAQQRQNINNNIQQRPPQKVIYPNQPNGQVNPNINQILNNQIPQQIQRAQINNYTNQTSPNKKIIFNPTRRNPNPNNNQNQAINSAGKIKVIKQVKYLVINETPNKIQFKQNNANIQPVLKRVESDTNLIRYQKNNFLTPQKMIRNPSPENGLVITNNLAAKNVPIKKQLFSRSPNQIQRRVVPQQQILNQPNLNGNKVIGQAF